jgi:F420H(2)-dependent biliverdin reductase
VTASRSRPVLPDGADAFLAERHLATLTTLRADGSPHVTAVGFTWDPVAGVARVITSASSRKAVHVQGDARVVLAQIDGPRWLSLEGLARVSDDPAEVADAVARYAERYQDPRPNPQRVALVVDVRRVLGRAAVRGPRDRG